MEVSRRDMLKGAGVLAAGLAATGAVTALGCASEPKEKTIAESTTWEAEADVVIVGTGAAGLSAASTMGIEGLGSCLILEAATEALSGGNSRVCGQGVFAADDPESLITYINGLNLPYVVDPELVRATAEELYKNNTVLDELYDADMQVSGGGVFGKYEGVEAIKQYNHQGKAGDQGVWKLLKEKCDELEVPYYYETRAVKLITNEAGEVIGVASEDGRNFKAKKGVILACGGFECNKDMMDCYRPVGCDYTKSRGTWYNVGDGITMATRLGAELWHMNSFSGGGWGIKIVSKDDPEAVAPLKVPAGEHGYIFIGSDAKRFTYEENVGHHGKIMMGGVWVEFLNPGPSYMIFDQAMFDAANLFSSSCYSIRNEGITNLASNQELLDAGIIVKCDTAAEIANAYGLDAAAVQATLDRYNGMAATGVDTDFARGQALAHEGVLASLGEHPNSGMEFEVATEAFALKAIEPPFYAMDLMPVILNTFGGPKRSAIGEVMHVDGHAIPRLFAAGELGSIFTNKYNGGSAFGEAISSGRVAARGVCALEPWA